MSAYSVNFYRVDYTDNDIIFVSITLEGEVAKECTEDVAQRSHLSPEVLVKEKNTEIYVLILSQQ